MTATYLVASVGNGQQFHSAKQFAAWLGLVPREFSSGGKQRLGRISKEVTAISVIFWSMVRGQLQPLLRDTKTICRGFTGC
ncbi:transposase IS116/IS110/IS902 family protein [Yersinia enterocolitica]|nr:transposase IS116/IS110/IS902 family protein [Yersinia enterocolitica]